ncbi:MAG: GIY-YIG nuclease family protein [Candidatus Hydrogenedens sp.]|nr:GIY-YIG nuclease family protein [Candidatus Hydrogenedens sp.]
MDSREPTVYILASKRNGTLYIGVTSDLERRLLEHREGRIPGFTKKYNVKMLVYHESDSDMSVMIEREKQLKKWNRAWKIELIEQDNPEWRDLAPEILGEA